MNQNTSGTKTDWNSLQWFSRYGIHKFSSGMYRSRG